VHRIGRTGRCGKTGVATSFINRECSETFLLDLKHLLREAKQKIPPVLTTLNDPTELVDVIEVDGVKGYVHAVFFSCCLSMDADLLCLFAGHSCGYCGGLGHRIVECPKLQGVNRTKQMGNFGYDVADKNEM
jgi:ATP-dependent RNA helicase DDX41